MHVAERRETRSAAWGTAREILAAAAQNDPTGVDMPPLQVVGEFTVPPAGVLRRDFQTLHIDFGLPIRSRGALDIARFTALHIDARRPPTTAATRVVPLRALLSQRAWPERPRLLANLTRYGTTGRARAGYVEGILARLVEAADGCSSLPPTADPNFLCGMEFVSLAAERAHYARHGLDLHPVEHRIQLGAGELLIIDNLATAHGRTGIRSPEELNQLCVGYRQLDVARQHTLLHRVLDAFAPLHN